MYISSRSCFAASPPTARRGEHLASALQRMFAVYSVSSGLSGTGID
jgi:hypothetical protein